MRHRGKMLWTLFYTMLYISACTFGGGFVIVSLMQRRFVEELGWLREEEMLDMAALAQSCPGAIAVNAAIQVGWRVAGFAGMLTAVVGTILPPLVLLGALACGYGAVAGNRTVALFLRGMQAGVAAVIADVALTLGKNVVQTRSWLHMGLMVAVFCVCCFTEVNVILLILGGVLVGVAAALVQMRGKGAR